MLNVTFPSTLGIQEFEDAIAGPDPLGSAVKSVTFSYESVTFIPMEAHVHALCLYNQLARAGVRVRLLWPEHDTLSYADRMGFFQLLDDEVAVRPRRPRGLLARVHRSRNPTLLELTAIVPADRASADRTLQLVYDRVRANVRTSSEADHVAGHVGTVATELVNNIFDWSETPLSGIIGIQRYGGKNPRVTLAIADSGVGITESLRKNNPQGTAGVGDQDLILKAFREGLSSRKEPGGGAGLTRCAAIATQYKGRLCVRTNRTWSKLIVRAESNGLNWNVFNPRGAMVAGTSLTFDLLVDRV
jgi:hypothetical protein